MKQLRTVTVHAGVTMMRLEYSDGEVSLIDYGWKDNVKYLAELKQQHDDFVVHDVVTNTTYKAGKKVTND